MDPRRSRRPHAGPDHRRPVHARGWQLDRLRQAAWLGQSWCRQAPRLADAVLCPVRRWSTPTCSWLPARAAQTGGLRVFAIRDLGWPVSLLDLATGTLWHVGSDSRSTSAVTTLAMRGCRRCLPGQVRSRPGAGRLADQARADLCSHHRPRVVRAAVDQLAWHLLDAALAPVPQPVLAPGRVANRAA